VTGPASFTKRLLKGMLFAEPGIFFQGGSCLHNSSEEIPVLLIENELFFFLASCSNHDHSVVPSFIQSLALSLTQL
jgi:hypothetical protein